MGVRRRKTRLPWSVTAFLMVLGVVVALNAVHTVGGALLAKTARRVVVEEGTVTLGTSGEAVLLRRELILVSPKAGVWHPQVSRGQRVSAGTGIGEVLDVRLLARTQQLQEKARGEKTVWESELMAKQQDVERTLAEVNKKIPVLLAELKSDLAKMQTARAEQLNNRLQELLRQRGLLLAEKEQLDREAVQGGAWCETEAEAQALMTQAASALVTPLAGRFEDRLDGYEDVFDPLEYKAALTTLTVSGSVGAIPVLAGNNVDQGQIVGKIIQEEPTFARVSLREELDLLSLDDQVEVYLPAAKTQLQARVEAIAREESETVAVLRFLSAPPAISMLRETEVQLICNRIRGASVPERALIRSNGQDGVYCWQQGKWLFKPVKVVALDQGQAIVSGISPGEEIALGLWF